MTVPRSLSYGVNILQLIRFAKLYSNVISDFKNRKQFLSPRLSISYTYSADFIVLWGRGFHCGTMKSLED